MKILFTSDLHGNLAQYKAIFGFALKKRIEAIIFGGDLLPKDKKNRTIKRQFEFFKRLYEVVKEFRKKSSCKIFLMLGNDDFKDNLKKISKMQRNIFIIIGNKKIKLGNYSIFGYPYVPPTPFAFKDWEKYDSTINNREFRKDGVISRNGKLIWKQIKFSKNNRIYSDLAEISKKAEPKESIYVVHSPPYKTSLDLSSSGHVGSGDVKKFIEEKQPYVCLHGHIHETVRLSGKFKQRIGKTICLSSGNYNADRNVSAILFNIKNPADAVRLVIKAK